MKRLSIFINEELQEQNNINEAMTIDKIKHYMGDFMFNHWISVKDIAIIKKAKDNLQKEIDSGLLTDIKYIAELELLKHLLL